MEEIKRDMIAYWSQRVDEFSAQRCREFQSPKRQLWIEEFQRYFSMDAPLRILDVGTGTGFFANILALEGHDVVGIDLTEHMIVEAKRKAELYHVPSAFYVMDAERPEFPDASFDVVISRNLTWALPNLGKAYKAWRRVLKDGGLLLNFDADYCHEKADMPLPAAHAHQQIAPSLLAEYERMKTVLRRPELRPQRDCELLAEAGFRDVRMDLSVWKRIYRDVDEFYNPTPIFCIAAYA